MPIINRNDAADVEERFERIFQVPPEQRAHELRRLFAEVLDFHPGEGIVPLAAASPAAAANPALPANAERIAQLDGVQALYVPLQHAPLDGRRDADRVRKQDVVAAARRIADRLGDDMLLVFANRSASQLHLIYPNFAGAQPTLRRMVVERGIPQRTAVQQVANIYWNYTDTGSIRQALDNAFDVDPVTKQFFTEYHRIFNEVERSIRGFGAGDAELDAKRTFTQTLFNRLMFIYFMSRKGWLAINRDRDYLNALWQDYAAAHGEQKNFYIDRLRPLFFAGLNNPKSQDHTHHDSARELIGDVPFLNGGLFEQTALDRRAETGGDDAVTVPDAALRRIMTDLFDKFNFTVQESTPYDVEVAVDPEMLGKVFEELVNDRHGSGSYYTPRAVVAFMCREALKGYLAGRDAALAPHAIAKFIDERDASGIPLADARRVGEALAAVAVVDPACGSGAYLLGMMQELVELQTALYNAGVDPKGVYELKLDIIQRNLYGVDNSDFAVNIAMLRMWLSLAIDYEGECPEPLPNLDLKLVCGDSLLGPDPSAAAYGDLFRALTDSRKLGDAKADYMRATHGDEKKRLREEIEGIERELQDALGDAAVPENIVDWRIAFAEVFADTGGGFDVVIANPPYVVVKDSALRAMYKEGVYGRMNLYGLFIQRSLQLIKEGSQLFFINPRTLLTDRYFTNLRKVIKQKTELKGVVLIADRHNTFERVLQECIILHLNKTAQPSHTYGVNTCAIEIPEELNYLHNAATVASERVLLGDAYDGAFYIGASEFEYQVFERMDKVGVNLDDFGVKAATGKVQFDKYRQYAQPTAVDGACRLIWAENTQRYAWRPSAKRVGKEWLSKRIASTMPPNIAGAGIITQRISANEQPRRIIASLIEPSVAGSSSVYSENHTNFISIGDKMKGLFLLAALNSSLTEFVFRRLNSNTQVSAGELNSLPFPPMPKGKALGEITELVSKLLRLGGVDCKTDAVAKAMTYEHRLDILIGALYGFSPSEVERIQELLPPYESVYRLPQKVLPSSKTIESNGRGGVASRGQAIYEEKIRQWAEPKEKGKFAVIDVYGGDYEIDASHSAAVSRLVERYPEVITYTVRIGYPTAFKTGFRSYIVKR